MQILIADDCPTTRNVLKKFLVRWGYEPVMAGDGEQALNLLTIQNGPRLAILDWNMPRVEGPAVCQRLRDANLDRYTYVIFLTAKEGEENLAEAMRSGADDYVTKPVSEVELKYRLEAGRRVIELQDRLLKSQRKIDVLSTQDPLTGVLNRTSVFERLNQELDRSNRKSLPVGLMIVQANDLKSINEEHGNEAGDRLLTELSGRLKKVIRTYDSAGRLEGNQFVIVLPDTNRHQAQKAADRVVQAVKSKPICIGSETVGASISVGVSNTLDAGYDFDGLLGNVSEAVARAKQADDCVRFALNDSFVGSVEIAQLPA